MSKEATARSAISTFHAMKLALEALEKALRYHGVMLLSDPPQDAWKYHRVEQTAHEAITALREALASEAKEQPAPVAKPHEQEPVAWIVEDQSGERLEWAGDAHSCHGVPTFPLYTSPPAQSKPLTDEEIWDEVKAADLDWQTGWSLDEDAANRYITFARAIEAAHGIKENT